MVVLLKEKLNEQWNIFQSFGRGRNANLNRAEPVKKIFTETPGKNYWKIVKPKFFSKHL